MYKSYRVSPFLTLAAYLALQPTTVFAQEVDEDVVEEDEVVDEDVVEEDEVVDEDVVEEDEVVDEDVVEEDEVVDEDVVEEDEVVDEDVVGEDVVEEEVVGDEEIIADEEVVGDEEIVGEEEGAAVEEGVFEPGEEPYRPPPAGMGVVWGRLVDIESGEPALEAEVKVKETGTQVFTDYDGYYRLELPPGSYTLEMFYELYEPSTLQGVVVQQGNVNRVDQKLTPQMGAIEEEIIEDEAETQTIEGLALARQRSVSQGDAIGREEISKGTDSNAAQAAQRVVGANIVGGRFVYVRGLGERYSNSLLSGYPLPSPEPDKAAVPLDVFPAAVLDSLTIVKTATVDDPMDFAGGSVKIETRSVPAEPLFKVSLSGGINSQATFQERLAYDGSPTDFLGFDSGKRAMADSVPRDQYIGDLTEEQAGDVGRDVIDQMSPQKKRTPINHGFSVVGGNTWKFKNESQLGVLASLNYSRKYEVIENAITREFRPSSEDERGYSEITDFKVDKGVEKIRWGAFGKLSYRINANHKLTLQGLHSQLADDYAALYTGYQAETQLQYNASQLDWVQRGMSFGMLSGRHSFPQLNHAELGWDGALASARRDEPNRRDTVYVQPRGVDGWTYQNSDESGRYFFANQTESSVGGKLDWHQPLLKKPLDEDSKKLSLNVGGLANVKRREFAVRRLNMRPPGGVRDPSDPRFCDGATYQLDCPDPLFQRENVYVDDSDPRVFNLVERPVAGDAYDGGLSVYAGYGMLDWEPSKAIRVAGGLRVEHTDQFVEPKLAIGGSTSAVDGAELQKTNLLPAISLILSATKKTKTRYSYARTIARPTVREIAPFKFASYFGGRTETGNPDLQLTTIDNFDARFEFWPTLTEVLAGSVFYKHLDLPIEQILIPGPASSVEVRYENADSANLIGLELEARKMLSSFTPALNNFSLITNLTLTYSRTEVRQTGTRAVTSPSRPLINQAPWVVNVALDYSNEETGTNARIAYNVNGRTLVLVGSQGVPDGYEQPRHSLDLGFSQEFLDHWSAKCSIENLINDDYLTTVGKDSKGDIWRQYRDGIVFGVGVGYEL